jgi:hypothetical protein
MLDNTTKMTIIILNDQKGLFLTFKNTLLSQNQSILKVLVMQKKAKQLQIKATVLEKCNNFILESKDLRKFAPI